MNLCKKMTIKSATTRLTFVCVFLTFILGCKIIRPLEEQRFTIAFGSCNRENLPQPLWTDIKKENPDLWIWLGDNIYGDSGDTAILRAKYNSQLANPGYQNLIKQVPVIGTWDDHDYGKNDGNKTFSIRKESQQLALDFLQEPKDSPRRKQEGIYTSYEYKFADRKIKVILLDVRYHQDPITRDSKGYIPNEQADILGNEQWVWLEAQLKNSTADVNIIGSGLQFIPQDHRTEKWGNYPSSRNRFFKLLAQHQPSGVLLISGDRHIGEFSKIDIPDLNYPLYEFTSSGLTHSSVNDTANVNRYRTGELVTQKHYAVFNFKTGGKGLLVEASLKGEGGKILTTETIKIGN